MVNTDQVEKVVNCHYHLCGECTKGRLRVKEEACVYCLERARENISFALGCHNFGYSLLFVPAIQFPEVR